MLSRYLYQIHKYLATDSIHSSLCYSIKKIYDIYPFFGNEPLLTLNQFKNIFSCQEYCQHSFLEKIGIQRLNLIIEKFFNGALLQQETYFKKF